MNHKYRKLIRTGNDPILKIVCDRVPPGESVTDLIDLMMRAARKSGLGVGLAAPQVGVTKCVIIVRTYGAKGIHWLSMVNPRVMQQSGQANVDEEMCLSYPGIKKRIKRANWVEVEYEDVMRRMKTVRLENFDARIFQHEFDHLMGICLVGDPSFAGEPDPNSPTTVDSSPTELVKSRHPMRRKEGLIAVAALLGAVGMMGSSRRR